MMKRVGYGILGGLIGLFLVATPPAYATIIDLTTTDSSTFVSQDGALFLWIDASSTGTGLIDPFVQIGANTDVTQAYNTTVNGTLDNGSSDQFNHELLLADVPTVTIDSTDYYEFLLDVNQSGSDELLSLDEIQIFTSSLPNQSLETFTGDIVNLTGTLIYNLDSTGDHWVKMDYSRNTGSGSGDMFLYVPVTAGGIGENYVYLYSKFGVNENANDGFEEWAIRTGEPCPIEGCPPPTCEETGTCPLIPEPSSMLLIGGPLLGALGFSRFRKGRKART